MCTELARGLSLRHQLTSDRGAWTLRTALSAAGPDDPAPKIALNNLGKALADRHRHTGGVAALDEAEAASVRMLI